VLLELRLPSEKVKKEVNIVENNTFIKFLVDKIGKHIVLCQPPKRMGTHLWVSLQDQMGRIEQL
jgi:hypothetical protein